MAEENYTGKLYLVPTVISPNTGDAIISPVVKQVISQVKYFLVENARTSRRYLKSLDPSLSIQQLQFTEIEGDQNEVSEVLKQALIGHDVAVLSEAGCPGVADPGASVVEQAHRMNLPVIPLPGPSSILLALMASGFNGQSFAFHGYLPIDKEKRRNKLKQLEQLSSRLDQTQIFIETPYRNQAMFDSILACCQPHTRLCLARDLTGSEEWIYSAPIKDWKKKTYTMTKSPTVYLLMG